MSHRVADVTVDSTGDADHPSVTLAAPATGKIDPETGTVERYQPTDEDLTYVSSWIRDEMGGRLSSRNQVRKATGRTVRLLATLDRLIELGSVVRNADDTLHLAWVHGQQELA